MPHRIEEQLGTPWTETVDIFNPIVGKIIIPSMLMDKSMRCRMEFIGCPRQWFWIK
jgi:hypothetical protein